MDKRDPDILQAVIVIFPIMLLIVAYVILLAPDGSVEGRGCRWFWAWTGAGFLFMFSLVTGFSIGLFVAPFALAGLLTVAWRSPHQAERAGLALGTGLVLLWIAHSSHSHGSDDPTPWLLGGAALSVGAIAAYALHGHSRQI